MVRKALLALAISAGLVGITGTQASAQAIVGRVYVGAPAVYVEGGRPPGPGYVWVPEFRRWEFHPYAHRFFYRGRPWLYPRRFYGRR